MGKIRDSDINVKGQESTLIENIYNNGIYYQHGLNYFIKDKCYCLIAYNWLIVIIILLLVMILSMYSHITSMLPISQTIPFVIYVDFDIDQKRALIKKLSTENTNQKSMNEAISQYIIVQYVKNREEYDYKNLERQSLIVKNNSFFQVYKDFVRSFDLRNKESPILKYKNKVKITVDILSISTYDIDTINARADIKIKKTLSTGEEFFENISLRYQISDIYLSYKKIVPLEFMVIEYEKNN